MHFVFEGLDHVLQPAMKREELHLPRKVNENIVSLCAQYSSLGVKRVLKGGKQALTVT